MECSLHADGALAPQLPPATSELSPKTVGKQDAQVVETPVCQRRSMVYPFPHARLRMVDRVAPIQYRDEQESRAQHNQKLATLSEHTCASTCCVSQRPACSNTPVWTVPFDIGLGIAPIVASMSTSRIESTEHRSQELGASTHFRSPVFHDGCCSTTIMTSHTYQPI